MKGTFLCSYTNVSARIVNYLSLSSSLRLENLSSLRDGTECHPPSAAMCNVVANVVTFNAICILRARYARVIDRRTLLPCDSSFQREPRVTGMDGSTRGVFTIATSQSRVAHTTLNYFSSLPNRKSLFVKKTAMRQCHRARHLAPS